MNNVQTATWQNADHPQQYKNRWEQIHAAAEKLGCLVINDMKAVLK